MTIPTRTRIFYHIILKLKTQDRRLLIDQPEALFSCICSAIERMHSRLYAINGSQGHIHFVCRLHQSQSLGSFMRRLKISTKKSIKRADGLGDFRGWEAGYGAFTFSALDKNVMVRYVDDQARIHRSISFQEELQRLLNGAVIIDGGYPL